LFERSRFSPATLSASPGSVEIWLRVVDFRPRHDGRKRVDRIRGSRDVELPSRFTWWRSEVIGVATEAPAQEEAELRWVPASSDECVVGAPARELHLG